jgi:hypothetical protein
LLRCRGTRKGDTMGLFKDPHRIAWRKPGFSFFVVFYFCTDLPIVSQSIDPTPSVPDDRRERP